MAKIEIGRIGDAFHLEARNEEGATLQMDASPDIGGTGKGMRPMQVLLTSLGGCSGIDVINILKKQRQPVEDIKITLEGEREKDVTPSVYRNINIHFRLYGNIDNEKASKAIALAVEKYCSVGKTLEPTATITHSFEIIK